MGGGGMMAPILSIATGLLIFVILIIFAPTIAGAVEDAQPAMAVDSDWNSTNNADLPTGAEIWTQNITILGVVVLIVSIAVAMSTDYGLRMYGACQHEVSTIFAVVEITLREWLEVPLSNPCINCRDWAV
jgi:hypothetical protein